MFSAQEKFSLLLILEIVDVRSPRTDMERVRILSDGAGDNAPCYGLDSCGGVQIR